MLEILKDPTLWSALLITFCAQFLIAVTINTLGITKNLLKEGLFKKLIECGLCTSFWLGCGIFAIYASWDQIAIVLPFVFVLLGAVIADVLSLLLWQLINYFKK